MERKGGGASRKALLSKSPSSYLPPHYDDCNADPTTTSISNNRDVMPPSIHLTHTPYKYPTSTMPSPSPLILLPLLLFLPTLSQSPEIPCYAPDGVTRADDTYRPCNNLGLRTRPGAASSCCRLNADPLDREICDASGLCLRRGVVRRGFCTDASWADPACVSVCTVDDEVRPFRSTSPPCGGAVRDEEEEVTNPTDRTVPQTTPSSSRPAETAPSAAAPLPRAAAPPRPSAPPSTTSPAI